MTSDVLRHAVAAHQAGRLDEARLGYDRVLADEPDHGWANYFRAVLADTEGNARLALDCLRRAAAAQEPPVQALVTLGNRELADGRAEAALAAFDAAIGLRPGLAAASTGRALALKRLGRLVDAMAAGRRALELRRGWQSGAAIPPGSLDPAEVAEMRRANRIKLGHDAAQLRH
jgi:tetratricopeptide (TPR) repeat protein